jgi:cobalt-precorrin 5A hydrolase
VRAELGIWAVRMEAEKLGEALAERLGGELFRPWLGKELQEAGPGWMESGQAESRQAESRQAESRQAESRQAESRQAESQKVRFREQFGQRSQWVLIMATGIATRFVDGLLRDKHQDPAVVVLDEAGRYAVALVGGHEGGANVLAYRVANAVGAIPVVTTATEAVKSLVVGIGCRKGVSEEQIERAVLHALARRGVAGPGGGVGSGVGPGAGAGPGGGVRAGAVQDGGAGGEAGLAAVRELATVDLKANEPGLLSFSQRHRIPLRVIARHQIEGRSWVSQPSEWVRQSVGLDGVCEPCALIASTRGRLVVPKTALDGVAVAIVADEWGLVS